jgi:ABC-2 type transport system permease protein
VGAALVVAGKDLRQRLRDRTAYIVGVVAPLVLAGLISLAFGRSGFDFSATFAVVDEDGGQLARAFVDDMLGDPGLREVITVKTVDGRDEAVRLASSSDVAAAIIVPAGYTEAATAGQPLPIEVVRSADKVIGADVAVAVAEGFTAKVSAVRLSVVSALAAGAGGRSLAQLAEEAAHVEPAVTVDERSAQRSDVPVAGQYAPGMGVFFMFFVVGMGARSLVAEQKSGTLSRLLAAPVQPMSLLAGKAGAALVMGVASLGAMAVASTFLLQMSWGDPVSASLLIVAVVLAATGITALILTLARTEQQASLYMSVVTMGLALLGGNFVSLDRAPELLRRLSLLTPNGWALRAFRDLAVDHGGPGSILPALGAILGVAVVTFAIAAARSRRLVQL